MALTRRFYLVILLVIVLGAAAAGLYLRHRAAETEKAVANCDTPAPPPKPATPPPKLPGFAIEPSCGPGGSPAKPAQIPKKYRAPVYSLFARTL